MNMRITTTQKIHANESLNQSNLIMTKCGLMFKPGEVQHTAFPVTCKRCLKVMEREKKNA